ncbi:MAG: tetratricopeptide repeat protein [Geminicoccaceae bacterium]|nr:tetratricopeptide repeat protein [Geminicoccaceae bacterium]
MLFDIFNMVASPAKGRRGVRLIGYPLDSTSKWSKGPLPSRSKIHGGAGLALVFLLAACIADPVALRGNGAGSARAVELPHGDASVAGAYLAGRVALDEGKMLEAAENFEIALSAEPDNGDLRRQVFLLRLAGGDLDKARETAASLVDLGIESDEARMLLAFDALRKGELDVAHERISQIGPGGISGMVGPLIDAWMQFAEGKIDEALTSISAGSGSDGLALVRTYHHASMLTITGREQDAYDLLKPAVVDTDRLPTRLLIALIGIEMRLGRDTEALATLDSQLALAPEDTVLIDLRREVASGVTPQMPIRDARTGMADALLSLARALGDQRGGGQGLILARLASDLAPDEGDIWLFIAQQMLIENNIPRALEALDNIPRDGLYSWDADLLRARAYGADDRDDEAHALLEEMSQRRPERSDALIMLGDMLRRDERFAEAEVAYSEAISRITTPGPDQWRLLYARGIAYERTDRWDLAEADFLKALELEPDQPFVLNYLGYSWVDKGLHLDRARGMLNRAVELRPDDGFIVDSLGWAHYRLGEYDDAVVNLERAVELQPDDPVINDHLGDAYWRVGREREARFQWERALIFNPDDDVAAEVRRKLESGLPAVSEAESD